MTSAQLDDDLPAGNIRVVHRDGDTYVLTSDLRDTPDFWFYWKFRVRGASGRDLTFRFEGGNHLAALGPAVSRDRGATWTWLSETPDAPEDHFRFTFGPLDEEVWFSMCIPYGMEEWTAFTRRLDPRATVHDLCHSTNNRPVPLLEIDGPAEVPPVWLTARHHCCETPANYVMEGCIHRWLELRPAPLVAVPFMDLDGVVAGDQGKNRDGRDHNRDYGPDSRYPEVRALKARVRSRPGPFRALDLHAPWIRFGINETVYFPGPEDPDLARALDIVSEQLESRARGLPYRAADNLPFGRDWNTASNYTAGLSCSKWMAQQPGCLLAATLEIPYANAAGTPVTPETARAFGASLAETLAGQPTTRQPTTNNIEDN